MNFLNNSAIKKTYLMNIYPSKGVIKESGQVYDSTVLFLMATQKNPNGSYGFTCETCKWGTSENYQRFEHLRLMETGPIEVEIEFRENVRGSGDNERKETEILNMRIAQLPAAVTPEKKAS